MQSTAIERALRRGLSDDNHRASWGPVQRVIHRQTSSQTLKASLERIVEEFDLPWELLIFAVTKVHNAPELAQCLFRCIQNIWRRVLVDGEAIAFRFFAEQYRPGPVHAQQDFTKQLLAIQSRDALLQNPVFLQAFKKTKYLIQTIQKFDPRTLPPTISLLHALVLANMPPFLIFLAAKDEPDSLAKREPSTGKLPLHLAMDAKLLCRRLVNPYRIRFNIIAKEDGVDGTLFQPLLSLLNAPSPVNLLCHLYPQAGSKADGPSSLESDNRHDDQLGSLAGGGHVPVETFLHSMNVLPSCIQPWKLSWNHISKIFLNDLQTVVRLAPQILDTRNLQNHLFPFMVPMLYWTSFDRPSNRTITTTSTTREDESWHNFLLTVSYTLLKENPMVLQHCFKSENVVIEPSTAYGRVLKQRITRVDQQIHEAMIQQEALKRRIAQLEQEYAEVLIQEKEELEEEEFAKSSCRATKRVKRKHP